jgi:hypothetical protein
MPPFKALRLKGNGQASRCHCPHLTSFLTHETQKQKIPPDIAHLSYVTKQHVLGASKLLRNPLRLHDRRRSVIDGDGRDGIHDSSEFLACGKRWQQPTYCDLSGYCCSCLPWVLPGDVLRARRTTAEHELVSIWNIEAAIPYARNWKIVPGFKTSRVTCPVTPT